MVVLSPTWSEGCVQSAVGKQNHVGLLPSLQAVHSPVANLTPPTPPPIHPPIPVLDLLTCEMKHSSVCWISEREREMFYLTTHSTHFIYGYMAYMVKDHFDSEKGNPLPPHRLLLSINSKGSFICTIPQTG